MTSAMDMSGVRANVEEYLKKSGIDRPDIFLRDLEDCDPEAIINAAEFLTRATVRAERKLQDTTILKEWARPSETEFEEAKKSAEEGNKLLKILLEVAAEKCSCRANRD